MYDNIWLGSEQTHMSYHRMMMANEDGSILEMMKNKPEDVVTTSAFYGPEDDEEQEFSIGLPLLRREGNVAIISISGGLVPAYAWYNSYFGMVSYEEIEDAMFIAAEDKQTKSILLEINSGGGAVAGLYDAADFIKKIDKEVKPVHAHTSSAMHSAAYWLASSARKITASPMASVGSIGALVTVKTMEQMYDNAGIKWHYFRSGEHKALAQAGQDLSDTAKEELQDVTNKLFEFFETQVYSGRPALAAQNSSKWNTGKTFFGKEGLAIGLVDEVISFDKRVAKLVESSNNEYVFSTENNSLCKEAIMNLKSLNADQQAKLAAGLTLEQLGLSDKALAEAKAELAEINAESDTDTVEDEASEAETEQEASSENEVMAEANEDGQSEDFKSLLASNADLNKQLAKAELNLEAAQAKLEEGNTKLEEMTSTQTKLSAIVAKAANRMQISLNQAASDLTASDVGAVLSAYEAAEKKFEATFQVGQKSSQSMGSRDDQETLKPRNKINKISGE